MVLTGKLTNAQVMYATSGEPYVSLTLNEKGAREFAALTTENVDKHLLLLANRDILLDAVVREPIEGGRLQITMGGARSPSELARRCQDLARNLRGGYFPPFIVQSVVPIMPKGVECMRDEHCVLDQDSCCPPCAKPFNLSAFTVAESVELEERCSSKDIECHCEERGTPPGMTAECVDGKCKVSEGRAVPVRAVP